MAGMWRPGPFRSMGGRVLIVLAQIGAPRFTQITQWGRLGAEPEGTGFQGSSKMRRVSFIVAALLAGSASLAAPVQAQRRAPAAAATSAVPGLGYTHRVLRNGLQVCS